MLQLFFHFLNHKQSTGIAHGYVNTNVNPNVNVYVNANVYVNVF